MAKNMVLGPTPTRMVVNIEETGRKTLRMDWESTVARRDI